MPGPVDRRAIGLNTKVGEDEVAVRSRARTLAGSDGSASASNRMAVCLKFVLALKRTRLRRNFDPVIESSELIWLRADSDVTLVGVKVVHAVERPLQIMFPLRFGFGELGVCCVQRSIDDCSSLSNCDSFFP